MRWLLWQKPVGQELAGRVKKSLIAEFAMDPGMVDKMRFSGKRGRYSNRPVKLIRIYDPVLSQDSASAAPSYDALDMKGSRRTALLFEGRIETLNDEVQVFLTDRRAP